MSPTLSKESWQAAARAAEAAIPVLIAKGRLHDAAQLSRRAKQFPKADGHREAA